MVSTIERTRIIPTPAKREKINSSAVDLVGVRLYSIQSSSLGASSQGPFTSLISSELDWTEDAAAAAAAAADDDDDDYAVSAVMMLKTKILFELSWVELSRDICSRRRTHNSAGRRDTTSTLASAGRAMWVLSWRLNEDSNGSGSRREGWLWSDPGAVWFSSVQLIWDEVRWDE